jgi:hypothetical protein
MARRKPTARVEFVFFDIVYEDGAQSSNRKIAASEVSGLEGDTAAEAFFMAQDDKIAEQSGRPRGPIKSITRSKV